MGQTKTRISWRGDQVVKEVTNKVRQAWSEIGQAVASEAQKQLYPGHGVVSGELRSSIRATATVEKNGRLTLQVGSPLPYALYIEIGGHNFNGYRYLRIGLAKVTPRILEFIKRHTKQKGQ